MISYDAIVIGGGFFGLRIALHLRELGLGRVVVLEKEASLLGRASYVNQARVHSGYHYPRSLLTAYRSRVQCPRFVEEFRPAIVSDFDKYYAVARHLSKVSAAQFLAFCKKIDAPLTPVTLEIQRLFNPQLIEAAFAAKEAAFDATKLRDLLLRRVAQAGGIDIRIAERVDQIAGSTTPTVKTDQNEYAASFVFNCTYSNINALHRLSGLKLLPFKHEIAEMCLVAMPKGLERFSLTVMDGPFFSLMPFPSTSYSTLSHVRYTPHTAWVDDETTSPEKQQPHDYQRHLKLKSNFPQMRADIARYVPRLKDVEYQRSIWEVKTVLLKSENDDSRPILFRSDFGINGYACIMGGKLDNIYDALEEASLFISTSK